MMHITLPDRLTALPGHASAGRRPRLLLVDDLPVNIQALHRVFATDCHVLMATDGARALQLCRDRQPDLVLLDVQMPGMDGHELCAELKAEPLLRAIAVILVTTQDHLDDETRGLDAGAADFLTKPFNPTVVRARVLDLASRAAEAGEDGAPGLGSALSLLGQSRHFGRGGMTKDLVAARGWYEKAAAAGDALATFNLGTFAWQGEGGAPKDEAAALALFRRAADLGDADALNNIGWFYQHGLGGLAVDKLEAAKWYRKADAGGVINANANLKSLGWLY